MFVENVRGVPRWLPGVVLEKVGDVSYEYKWGKECGGVMPTRCTVETTKWNQQ